MLKVYLGKRSDHAYAWFLFGIVLYEVGRFKEAESALLSARKLASRQNLHLVQAHLAKLREKQGDYKEAERWYFKACKTKQGKNKGWLWVFRGINLARQKRFQLAEVCLKLALTLDDVDKDEAYRHLGIVMRAEARYQEAEQFFAKTIELEPKDEGAKEGLESLTGFATAMAKANEASEVD